MYHILLRKLTSSVVVLSYACDMVFCFGCLFGGTINPNRPFLLELVFDY